MSGDTILKVLVACEFSQVVTKAFRNRGHEAWSCDLLPTEGVQEWHIQDDVLNHLDEGWDLIIAHPNCQFLCNSGVWALHRFPVTIEGRIYEGLGSLHTPLEYHSFVVY